MSVSICEVGAAIQSVVVPDGRGNFVDVALGYDGAPGYLHNGACIGAILGRNANRIAGARFELGGTTHRLAANDGPNNLRTPGTSASGRWGRPPTTRRMARA